MKKAEVIILSSSTAGVLMSGSPPVEGFTRVSRRRPSLKKNKIKVSIEEVLGDIQRIFQEQYEEEVLVDEETLKSVHIDTKMSELSNLNGKAAAVKVEATDILEDVDDDQATLEEVKENLEKLVSLRSVMIEVNAQRKALDAINYDSNTEERDEDILTAAVKKLRDKKKALGRSKEKEKEVKKTVEETAQKECIEIMIEGFDRLKFSLKEELGKDTENILEEEVRRRMTELPKLEEKVNTLENKQHEIIEKLPAGCDERASIIKALSKDLRTVHDMVAGYKKFIEEEVAERDLHEGKKEAETEIKLETFSGKADEQDFYSFKSRFEKKYNNVRKQNIPEILKSYLKKEALESVLRARE